MKKLNHWGLVALALLGTVPAIAIVLAGLHLAPLQNSLLFGVSILSAAFLLSWGAEAAQRDISQALALALVAIITVLPEYAVDFTFAWKAGEDISYAPYAAANMTGANRLLIGIAWPLVVIIAWLRHRHATAHLQRSQAMELAFLGAATLYSFTIFLKQRIDLFDAFVLISLFFAYLWLSSRAEVEEPELIGPAALIGSLSKAPRRLLIAAMFLFSATIIFMSAEPFAEGLVRSGKALGIDEFLLVQWLAPLASEAPEVLVACLFALRGNAPAALGILISAKLNQWTLLVGSLPVVFSVSSGYLAALPLDFRQTEEFLLTAAQSFFAIVLLSPLVLSIRGAAVLFLLFITQLALTDPNIRYVYAVVYLLLSVLLLLGSRRIRQAAFQLPRLALQEAYLFARHEPLQQQMSPDFPDKRPRKGQP